MPIDFPNSPVEGQTYDFGGVRYTWTEVAGSPGYWRVSEPGLAGPASVAEINAGTEAFKYNTPQALDGSEYMRSWGLQSGAGAPFQITKSANASFTGSNGITTARAGNNLQISGISASVSQRGTVQLSNATNSQSQTIAATSKAVNDVLLAAAGGAYSNNLKSGNGWCVIAANFGEFFGNDGILVQWGSHNMNGGSNRQTVTFPRSFSGNPYTIQLTAWENDESESSFAKVLTRAPTQFELRNYEGNTFLAYYWFAIGRATAP